MKYILLIALSLFGALYADDTVHNDQEMPPYINYLVETIHHISLKGHYSLVLNYLNQPNRNTAYDHVIISAIEKRLGYYRETSFLIEHRLIETHLLFAPWIITSGLLIALKDPVTLSPITFLGGITALSSASCYYSSLFSFARRNVNQRKISLLEKLRSHYYQQGWDRAHE